MRIIVLGASDSVGSRTAAEALSWGHWVTTVVRDPTRELPEGAA